MSKKKRIVKTHVKKDDVVMVIAGNDKGTTGRVLSIDRAKGRAIVEEVNMVTKHRKVDAENTEGRVQVEAPIHLSNLMLLDPESGDPTRIGRKLNGERMVRYSKKSGEIID